MNVTGLNIDIAIRETLWQNPPMNGPLCACWIVVEPDAGIRNETLGSTTAAGIGVPLLLKKFTAP
jgi:hypothetical protein